MRKMSESLQILLNNIHYIGAENIGGLCSLCLMLYYWSEIDMTERVELKIYMDNHRPINIKNTGGYYWRMGAKAPRIKWLKEQIKQLKSQGL